MRGWVYRDKVGLVVRVSGGVGGVVVGLFAVGCCLLINR